MPAVRATLTSYGKADLAYRAAHPDRRTCRLPSRRPVVLGVDVGGTHTKVAAFDLGGELLGTRALDLLAHGEGIGTGERLK